MPNVYFDFETRAGAEAADLRRVGTYRYANHAEAIILSYAIDDGPVRVIHRNGKALSWDDLPELHPIFEEAIFVAWNAGFDRAIWNYALLDSPFLKTTQIRDAMAVASVNNLPLDLERAAKIMTGRGKQEDGKALIALFCGSNGADPAEHMAEWRQFLAYASLDVIQMRAVWKRLRPLPAAEWAVYAANEAINDRGIPLDLDFVEAAARLAAQDKVRTNRRLAELTDGIVTTVYQHERIAQWAYDRTADAEARTILVSYIPEDDDDEKDGEEEIERPPVLSCTKKRVARLRDYLVAKGDPDPVLREVLDLREFGASASSLKFRAMLDQNVGGYLHGQIRFNGAGQTGRFSGKGVQPQNMTRATLGLDPGDDYGTWEAPTIDFIADGCTLDGLASFGLGEPPAKKLSLLVRPAIMAPRGKTIIKADFSQIEARVLPFLSGGTQDDLPVLKAFRALDLDPSLPDIYKVTAAAMLGCRPDEVSKEGRQAGKISILACGYQGGRNALMSMAASYNIYFTPEQAGVIVAQWREANPWAPRFWGRHNRDESYGLFGAAMRAVNHPGTAQKAGRILFVFMADYLGGSLLMRLPSGRLLTYPWCKIRDYTVKDKVTKKVIAERRGLTFKRDKGITAIYGGLLAENATQAAAADLLRDSLVELDGQLPVIMHAHDEITAMVDEDQAEAAAALLNNVMTAQRSWTEGLPLAVDTTIRFYYSSAKLKEAA